MIYLYQIQFCPIFTRRKHFALNLYCYNLNLGSLPQAVGYHIWISKFNVE